MSIIEGVATGQLVDTDSSLTVLDFVREFFSNPAEVASLLPSSSFLHREIARQANLKSAKYIVDLGPGLGGTTRSLLQWSNNQARIVAVETNETFVAHLSQLGDARLSVVHRSAADLRQIIEDNDLPQADVIVSGVPFSTMDAATSNAMIDGIYSSLKPGGSFIAYQLRDRVCQLAEPLFGPASISFVWRNLPPLRVFCWQK
ncbi:class I SAM-dependent methyltransferase [Rubripirellula reticaptiva]|uniref:16S ribosomal RNA methyltransferase KsgA/Dim1 family protein n=1 Tax=Rubripirellula reticaptiva TaxID=2528013 RepID=A0A5C6EDU7_9BACT|nr:methyltransferase domain-containing protein [Rubripirellula reticaptiva]TWU46820.1 16S ribosomal RNA methyltransferase KsgA/Dim1 family protein [Rubripirellula reticaptiva]